MGMKLFGALERASRSVRREDAPLLGGAYLVLCHAYRLSCLRIEIYAALVIECGERIINIKCPNKTFVGNGS